MEALRTRFAPSPTGGLHVGGARTALFSYVLARKTRGTFLVRIEDTDRARHVEEAVARIVADLRWLGIDWDEGVDVGGPNAPYRQSERLDLYDAEIDRLLREHKAYHAFETPEQLDVLRQQARQAKRVFVYPRPDPLPTEADADRARAAGRCVVVRLLRRRGDVTLHDDAFGDVTMPDGQMDDFIIRKADGWPTYHFAVVVDDAAMGVNYIVRGQEFLGQTWRHVLLREALGYPPPGHCHLPIILDMQGRKLSKRAGDVEVGAFRAAGYLPEAMVNFIALLGWSPGKEREKFTLDELVDLFGVDRIGKANAKFDREKLLAFSTDAVAAAGEDRLLAAFRDYLALNPTAPGPIPTGGDDLLRRLIRINRGFRTFADIPAKCGVLFAPNDAFTYDEKAVSKVLRKGENAGFAVLADVRAGLAECPWTAEALEAWTASHSEAKGFGVGKVAQPIRVAVTGTTVSPGIFETLLLLGRANTLARIDRCLSLR